MKVQVRLNNYRRSASKVRELIPLIKGLDVIKAENQLRVSTKGSAPDMLKLLLSAVATAKNDFNLKEQNLFVENIMVQEGRVMKRWRARAYGRANQILKRSCHILLTVKEREDKIRKEDGVTKRIKNKKKDEKSRKDGKSKETEKIKKKEKSDSKKKVEENKK